MGGVPDVEGLCRSVLDAQLRRSGNAAANIDYPDALGHLMLKAYAAYRKFDPTRGVPFLPYATAMLRHGLSDWYRGEYGRDEPKAHVGAVSLDAPIALRDDAYRTETGNGLGGFENRRPRLVAALPEGTHDPTADCDADLRRILHTRSGEDAREESRMGLGPDAGVAAGASGA